MTRTVLTYRDYEALPHDGRQYEIHDGELSVTPAPTPQHQIVSINIVRVLASHVPAVAPGMLLYAPLGVILADTTIVQPDIVYLAPDRLHFISQRGIEGPPTGRRHERRRAVDVAPRATRASGHRRGLT